jgi:hypothetical protein
MGWGGMSRCPSCLQNAYDKKDGKDTHIGPVLPEQRRGWSLMIFCARATRGCRLPLLGLMARLGVPVGGRVEKLRAVEDQSVPIPGERTSELGGMGKEPSDRPSCSQNAHDRNVLVRCAH